MAPNSNNPTSCSIITLLYLNIRSQRDHFIQIRNLARDKSYEVISLSETWLNSSVKNAEINIEGYKLFRQDRQGMRGGGVGVYIRVPLKAKVLKDMWSTSNSGFHQLWLQVQHKKKKSVVICVTYRPPNCPVSCLDELLKPNFTIALTSNKPIIVLGDLNCNLLQNCPENKALVNFVSDLNLKQLITSPTTRITDTCNSLIDVVMVSTPDLVHESGIMTRTISDHLPVYVMLKLKRPKPPPCYVTLRSYTKYNSELFSIDLASKSDQILPIFTENDVNTKLSMFNDVFLSTLERHAPVMTIKVRNRPCPYVTQEIKVLMNERDQLHRKFQLSRDIKDWQAY